MLSPTNIHAEAGLSGSAMRRCGLTLGELETLARTRLTGFFPFLHARITREEAFRTERNPKGLVRFEKSAANGKAQGPGLASDAATGSAGVHVETMDGV